MKFNDPWNNNKTIFRIKNKNKLTLTQAAPFTICAIMGPRTTIILPIVLTDLKSVVQPVGHKALKLGRSV